MEINTFVRIKLNVKEVQKNVYSAFDTGKNLLIII